ncbi:hypothetical protein SAMN05428969_0197 [Devosia sp. YR412]|uniref:hypothetical protein n=1 Tax=Devosia sp. YR412 TaxID=1881030 RepID=UPI0008D4DEEA|nr:hypothetical protein [Devosia sp. YR412]SEP62661.1 hypothetical protein SAMN05428969_0197 [Devosia sp. YR412]
MRRFIALITLVFAFASLAGTTMAHAHRYVSTPMVVLNHVDENNQSIPVIVGVQRGEIDLGEGIMLPCGAHHGIPVSVAQLPVCPAQPETFARVDEAARDWFGSSPRRPPKQA